MPIVWSQHLVVVRNIVFSALFFLLCKMYLYDMSDLNTEWFASQVNTN